jgi:hypothetical protein
MDKSLRKCLRLNVGKAREFSAQFLRKSFDKSFTRKFPRKTGKSSVEE